MSESDWLTFDELDMLDHPLSARPVRRGKPVLLPPARIGETRAEYAARLAAEREPVSFFVPQSTQRQEIR